MKISLNWLKDYIDIPCEPSALSEILTNLGLEVEGMDKIESIQGGLEGIVIGYVEKCIKHPDADRLSLAEVNIGQEQRLQIVCGAPNVAAGQKVPVAAVGTTLFPIDGEPLVIKKGKIRGEVSEGMICAEDELGIGVDHSGIMVLPEHLAIGSPLNEYITVETDYVFDIGLTPNRSDATSHLGVAKDLAAYFSFHYKKQWKVKPPAADPLPGQVGNDAVKVTIVDREGCPRYSGVSLSGIKIKPSPAWMQNRLKSVDVRPINNIVDITNYVLHEYGQPLHAFDQLKIANKEVIVKTLPEGASFVSLDEIQRVLKGEDLMICDGNGAGMCIAGIYGGLNSGVTGSSRDVFLESAHFNPTRIRKSSTAHNLRTDAARCFEKGTDPNNTIFALKRAAFLMVEYAGATVSSPFVDIYPSPIEPAEVRVRHKRINTLIGNDLSEEEIKHIFDALSMDYTMEGGDFYVKVPTDKIDVTREADVIEEILRIYGFNNISTSPRLNTSIIISKDMDLYALRRMLTSFLAAKGFSEMMGLSFVPSKWYKDDEGKYDEPLVLINNTSNIHLDSMRPEMMMSSLSTISYNHNRQQQNLRLFEFGTAYRKMGDVNEETRHLTIVLSGNEEEESWLMKNRNSDFYTLKLAVTGVLEKLGVIRYQSSELEDTRFEWGLRFHLGTRDIVKFGLVSHKMANKFDLKSDIYFAEFSLETLHKQFLKNEVVVRDIPKYPGIRRDLSLTLPNQTKFEQIEAIVRKAGGKLLDELNLFDVYMDDELKSQGKKSYAISMTFVDPSKNLRDKDVDKIINKIISQSTRELEAVLR